MLDGVKQRRVSEQTLLQKLTEYVERIDTDLVGGAGGGGARVHTIRLHQY